MVFTRSSPDDGIAAQHSHHVLSRGLAVMIISLMSAVAVMALCLHLDINAKDLTRWRDEPKRILVTGAAGFVGFHVAMKLSKDPSNTVIGIDNFNDYYDVQLKIDRAYELYRHGVIMHYADLCDESFLKSLFEAMNFTHVIHLGAQAGVRYSLEHPLTYIKSNIEGHQSILDVVKKYKDIHLVYASSSSVYGKKSPIPFRLSANVDNPGNMYAATKRANELMSYQHCTQTGIRSIGLRFFTVYGPWGRPDMAVYKFAEKILDGQAVPMFHISEDQPLGRDFTYVDDIVSGVVSAMTYNPAACGIVFNLGYGNPVSVPQLVNILEEEIGEKAQIDKQPLPPTEILQTWADTKVSETELDFQPKTSLIKGVKNFVRWLKTYRERRKQQESGSGPSVDAKVWFEGLYAAAQGNRSFTGPVVRAS